jgi:hypothetical protein
MPAPLAKDENIADINDIIRRGLNPGPMVHTEFGPKYLRRITLSDGVAELLNDSTDRYNKLLDLIRHTPHAQGPKREFGAVTFEGVKYCWWFEYWDSTHHFKMPNGHRELRISLEDEIDE